MRKNEFLFKLLATNTRFSGLFQQNGVRFAAKRSAFWCKMQCVLVQDGVRFGAKCKVKWYKMEGKMALNAR